MRADRLVSLVLLLRQRGRLTATELADELEVSTRTVLRDIDALSTAGVPVYAERGRHGGFALLPGFRTELTGLNHDEALALLATGSSNGAQVFGLGTALGSAVRKVLDAVPDQQRSRASGAAQRFLLEPDTDLLSRRAVVEDVSASVLSIVRSAVVAGSRVRIHYAADGQDPAWRSVDPVGLVTVRGRAYLLATHAGADRTYRLSRIVDVEQLAEPAVRPEHVDLARVWQERCARFLAEGHLTVLVRVVSARRDELLDGAVAVLAEASEPEGHLRLQVTFQDTRHAVWALWQLGQDAEVLAPLSLRAALGERASAMARRYDDHTDPSAGPG